MTLIVEHFFWILIVSGALTATMIQGVIAPAGTVKSWFGAELSDSAALRLIVRTWAFLIAAGGLLLIYAAFEPAVRVPVLVFIGAGKALFAASVFAHGTRFMGTQSFLAAIIDSVMVALFAVYLIAAR